VPTTARSLNLLVFWLKPIVKSALLPPAGMLLVALIGLLVMGRFRRTGRALAIVGVVALALLAMPAVSGFLIHRLDRTPAFDPADAGNAQAIVILGGGTRPYAAEYHGPTIGTITLERVRYGARLARATGLPVLVSGGAVRGAPPEAVLMRSALLHDFGIAVRWTEAESRNTHENAVKSAAILKGSGVERIILVGHSFDFPRSRKEFEAAGMRVIPAPIDIPPDVPTEVGDYLPSAGGLQRSYYALYEILANVLFCFTTAQQPASRAVSPGNTVLNGNSSDTRSRPR
jgi:uncharacterized SAM-binding protein YcdF (DUF218 family)